MPKFAITFVDWEEEEVYLEVVSAPTEFQAAKKMTIFDNDDDQEAFARCNSFFDLRIFIEEDWHCLILIKEITDV